MMGFGGEDLGGILSPDEQEYFRELENTFNTRGWDLLRAEITREIEAGPKELFWSVKSYEELVAARLRLAELYRLANYSDDIELRRNQLITERLHEASEKLTEDGAYE
jgi:hypothetical protein